MTLSIEEATVTDLAEGAKEVGPHARKKLSGLIRHYMKKPHPFTSCVRDNTKRFGKDGAERVCATLKDIGKGTTKWRKGGGRKVSEAVDALVEAGISTPEGVDLFAAWLQEQIVAAHGPEALEEIHAEHIEQLVYEQRIEEARKSKAHGSSGKCASCGKGLPKTIKSKMKKCPHCGKAVTTDSSAIEEAVQRGGSRVELKRLPDGSFAPKGRGQVLKAGDKISYRVADGEPPINATVEDEISTKKGSKPQLRVKPDDDAPILNRGDSLHIPVDQKQTKPDLEDKPKVQSVMGGQTDAEKAERWRKMHGNKPMPGKKKKSGKKKLRESDGPLVQRALREIEEEAAAVPPTQPGAPSAGGQQTFPDQATRTSQLQRRLRHLGHELLDDGQFGPRTDAAVRTFQEQSGLKVDGVVGERTKQALRAAKGGEQPQGQKAEQQDAQQPQGGGEAKPSVEGPLYKGMGVGEEEPHEHVAKVQQALGLKGDGQYGPETEKKVRAFQRKHGLAATGIVDPRTLRAMRLSEAEARADVPHLAAAERRVKKRRRKKKSARAEVKKVAG